MSDLKSGPSPAGAGGEINITTTPHSGDLGLEHPVTEFDNTSLQEAVDSGLITVPDTVDFQPTTGETETIHEIHERALKPESTNPIVRFLRTTRGKVVSGGVGIGMLVSAGTTAAVIANSGPDEAPLAPVSGEPFTPAPDVTEPTTPETAAPQEETIPAELAPYKEMLDTEFAALPQPEQARYIKYLFRNMPEFVQAWKKQVDSPNDVYAPASATDGVQEALAGAVWPLRYALSLEESDALKAIAFLYGGTTSDNYLVMKEQIQIKDSRPAEAIAESRSFPIETVISSDPLTVIDGRPTYNNVIIPANGTGTVKFTGTLTYFEYPEVDLRFWSSINQ